MTIVIKGGSVVGVSGVKKVDVLIDNDIIAKVGNNLKGDVITQDGNNRARQAHSCYAELIPPQLDVCKRIRTM